MARSPSNGKCTGPTLQIRLLLARDTVLQPARAPQGRAPDSSNRLTSSSSSSSTTAGVLHAETGFPSVGTELLLEVISASGLSRSVSSVRQTPIFQNENYTANFLQGRNGNENLRGCDIHGFMGGTLAKAHISVSRM